LWAAKKVMLGDNVVVNYAPLSFDPNYISPYYPPPEDGKVLETTNIIGSELTSLAYNIDTISKTQVDNDIFLIVGNKVAIEIVADGLTQYNQLLSQLSPTDIINASPENLTIAVFYPITQLNSLNSQNNLINFSRPLYQPLTKLGLATTQGDIALRTNLVRNGYTLDGDSVKVGVLSDSYNTKAGNPAQVDISNGDLPGTGNPLGNTDAVQVLRDFPANLGSRTDEGRAMLQIIHDIAPKADLAFRTGFISAGDFADGIIDLANAGCKVIVDDITYITEPFFKDGAVAKAVDSVVKRGVTYFSAAGNYGVKSYEGEFVAGGLPTGLATGVAHNFGGSIYQQLQLPPGTYTMVLQWQGDIFTLGGTGTQTDLDIYLVGLGGLPLFGFNRINMGGDPIEVLPFTVNEATTTQLMIVNAGGPNVRFKYIIFRGEGTILNNTGVTSTIVGQANATGAISIGAVLYTNTPAFNGVPSPASFSSRGGTQVENEIRNKPEIMAPNGVNTTVEMGGVDIDGDGRPNFFGTSAAAPHAAAATALIIQAKKKFSNQVLTPEAIRLLLKNTAIDMGTAGYDAATGYGFLHADGAMRTFAVPKPTITALEVLKPAGIPDNVLFIPGTQPFTLKVKGNNLSQQTKIFFRTDSLPTQVNASFTEATAVIPTFEGNPGIRLYTAPITSRSLDGGFSNEMRILDPVKKVINVNADNKTKKYAAEIPNFTATVYVDGVRLDSTGYTLDSLGLDSLTFTTTATANSNVNRYIIFPEITRAKGWTVKS
jgi:hypothetical protein